MLTRNPVESAGVPGIDFVPIDVGVEREKIIGVEQRSEKSPLHLANALNVEFEVVPRLSVRNHVPARGIGPIGVERFEGVNGIPLALRHFLAVFVEHQPR